MKVKQAGYPVEFKLKAVALVKDSGQGVAEIARSLGVPKSTLHDWVNQQSEEDEEKEAKRDPVSGEVLRLKRELEAVKKERDFLKKACAFFAQDDSKRSS